MQKTRLRVIQEAINVLLLQLECLPPSERAEQLLRWIRDCLRDAEQLNGSPPPDREKDVFMKRVLALYVEVTKLERHARFASAKGSVASWRTNAYALEVRFAPGRLNIVLNRSFPLLGVLLIVSMLSLGCTHIATYDRAQLAHPSMTRANLDGPGAEHVYSVHEGAIGGGSVAESGCGCN
jgi:hypothetical protein